MRHLFGALIRTPAIWTPAIWAPALVAVACTQPGAGTSGRRAADWRVELRRPRPRQAANTLESEPTATSTPAARRSADQVRRPAHHGLQIAVVSDLNSSYGSTTYDSAVHSAIDWLVDDVHPDLVLSTGDMVAGQRQGLDYDAMWRGFHAAVTRPLAEANIPLAVTPGNHDASAGAAFRGERMTFVEQWRRRRPALEFVDDAFFPLHYAFEIGPALIVSLDTTMTGPIDAHQRRWLRHVLATYGGDAKVTIVFGHVPLYPFSEQRKSEVLGDQKLEALLDEFGVDLMISGHHHAYYPGRRDGLRVLGMACLGSGARTLMGADQASPKSVALVEVSADGRVSVDAYRADDHAKIDRQMLPTHLNDGRQRIWRDDIVDK